MKHSVLLAEVSQACDECPSERPTNDRWIGWRWNRSERHEEIHWLLQKV